MILFTYKLFLCMAYDFTPIHFTLLPTDYTHSLVDINTKMIVGQKVPGQKELHTDKKYLDKKYQA